MKISDKGVEINEVDYMFFGKLFGGLISFRIPKNKKDKIGIVIAINTENETEKVRLQNDLIANIKKYLENPNLPKIFHVIELPQKYTKNIHDQANADKYLQKTRGHLMIYGNISERMSGGKNHYNFHLAGKVNHNPVPMEVSKKLSQEFTELMPLKLAFPSDEELIGFQATHEWLSHTTKYIIGISLIISNQYDLAESIFEELKDEMSKLDSSIPAVKEIAKRIPLRLIEVANGQTTILYFKYTHTRDIKYIQDMQKYLAIYDKYQPQNYYGTLMKSIYLFLIDKNPDEAIKIISKIKTPADITWRYNLAFLHAYKGNLKQAKKEYDKAFTTGVVANNVIADTEVFMSDILTKEPDKYQLLFLRGYLNFKGKGDKVLALKDFNDFIQSADKSKYKEEIRLSEVYKYQLK